MTEEAYLPAIYQRFSNDYRGVQAAFESLSEATHTAGPLTDRDRRLVKLGIAIGRVSDGGVRSNARKALAEGFQPEEVRHAAVLAITSGGLPTAMAALSWIDDVIGAM